MDERDDEQCDAVEPSVTSLIWRGFLMIVFAFIAAIYVLIVHTPSGH